MQVICREVIVEFEVIDKGNPVVDKLYKSSLHGGNLLENLSGGLISLSVIHVNITALFAFTENSTRCPVTEKGQSIVARGTVQAGGRGR
jgi:hypothetical protein